MMTFYCFHLTVAPFQCTLHGTNIFLSHPLTAVTLILLRVLFSFRAFFGPGLRVPSALHHSYCDLHRDRNTFVRRSMSARIWSKSRAGCHSKLQNRHPSRLRASRCVY